MSVRVRGRQRRVRDVQTLPGSEEYSARVPARGSDGDRRRGASLGRVGALLVVTGDGRGAGGELRPSGICRSVGNRTAGPSSRTTPNGEGKGRSYVIRDSRGHDQTGPSGYLVRG